MSIKTIIVLIIFFLCSCTKKEECKSCIYYGLSFHENGGSFAKDSAWLIEYDTIQGERCANNAVKNKYETYVEERWVKFKTDTTDFDTLYRFVHDGTWFCE